MADRSLARRRSDFAPLCLVSELPEPARALPPGAGESPWFDRYGIHVLVSQNGCGELTIGDSHEYGDPIEPFDKTEIDEWILGYLKTFLDAPVFGSPRAGTERTPSIRSSLM